jgi:hypothetical protein
VIKLSKNLESKIIIALGLVILVLVAVLLIPHEQKKVSVSGPEETKWVDRIHAVGSAQAYQEFKQEYKDVNFGTQHTMAHVVGAEIFQEAGIDGVQICDNDFAFGCYHGYFSRALSSSGLELVEKFDQACVAKFGPLGTGCQHGIGHGLMEYFGTNLMAALDACGPTTAKSELAGCVSGVFMEYNVPIVIDSGIALSTPRKLDENKPYDPCPSLPGKYQSSCYYEISAWWKQAKYNDNYQIMGELCQNVPNPLQKENCFLGIGNVAGPSSMYQVDQAINYCEQIKNNEGMISCLAGASWAFYADPDYRSLAVQVCARLTGDERKACDHKAHVINPENI